MITGEIKNKLDRLWDAMWSNQMTNPWIDIQQVTYLIFIKMLDDNQIRVIVINLWRLSIEVCCKSKRVATITAMWDTML